PGITGRRRYNGTLTVMLADGRTLRGPAGAAAPFAPTVAGLDLDGTWYADPAALVAVLPLGPHTTRLAAEVADSVANLALARAAPGLGAPPGVRATGHTVAARPLMSLRTLALPGGWHVKTAVDVQMASAVRTVSPAAVRNGPVVSALLGGLGSRAGIDVLREV